MSYLKYDGSVAAESNAPGPGLYGTDGSDTLTGTAAAEALWGKGGDLMIGGAGDDTYYLQDANDKVVEQADGGVDTVVAWKNISLTTYQNVENVKIDGDGIYAAGDSHDNVVYAGSGAEQLYGGAGQDVLVAGSGQDTFIVVKGEGNDSIEGFKTAGDVVRLGGSYSNFSELQSHMTQVGADVRIDMGGGDGLVLRNVQASQLTAANFQLGLDTAKLGQMTFHDEFSSGASIWNGTYNPTGTWRPDYGYQGPDGVGSYTLTGNGELQVYTSPYYRDHNGDFSESPFKDNGDGTMSIVAKPSTNSELFGYNYTSGMISTKESFAQTYGYFEMRAELPQASGGWPAFWLVPADGSWPPELDVMETLTNDAHADWTTWHSEATGTHTSHGIASYIPDTASGFHTYGVLWTKTDLVWYVDGAEVFHQATPADMNKPMYMIANLALGGWGGSIDNAQMPEELKIDYIRSYGLADGSTSVQGFDANHASGTYTSDPSTTASHPVSPPPVSPPPVTTPVTTPVSPPPVTVSPPPVSPPPVSPPPVTSTTGTDGADTLVGSQPGGETLTGGAGHDVFSFNTVPWVGAHVSDFVVGEDKLDFSHLFSASGYAGGDAIADGYVRLLDDGTGTWVIYDKDGHGSVDQWGTSVVHLDHVAASSLTDANLFGGTGGTPVSPPPAPVSPPPVGQPTGGTGTPGVGGGIVLAGVSGGSNLQGTAGDDTITGADGSNYLRGGAGNDVIQGGSGFNDINGNQGDDTITGSSSVGDWLVGGQGNDLVTSHGTGDILYGNLGNDTLMAGEGPQLVRGGQGDDSIVAGSGGDWISGDRGSDTIQAGAGADTFHTFSGAGLDRVIGFDPLHDHVQLDPGTAYTVSQVGADTVIDMGAGDQMILQGVQESTLPQGWIFGA